MKTESLKKQIIKNLCITAFLAAAFSSIIYFYSSEKGSTEIKITKINNETSQINVELADLQSKTTEIKKYKEMWPTISEDKKNTSGIKADEVNAKLSALADKYGIANQTIKLSLPEMLKDGVFNCTTTSVTMSTVNITFTAVDDVKAIMFASEFLNSLKGYPVVTSFSINKKSDYTDKDLVEISSGKSSGFIEGKISFFWYVYKDLEKKEDQKPATTTPDPTTPKVEGSNAQPTL